MEMLDEVLDGNVKKLGIDTMESIFTMEAVYEKGMYHLTWFYDLWEGRGCKEMSATEVMNKDRFIDIIEQFEDLAYRWDQDKS